ncbi:MAG: DUF3854 domain-containing protein [Spirochaetes bacterium]|nr:MAG: DUF3854 domain-containing protein [Spirochaetota bacterium]
MCLGHAPVYTSQNQKWQRMCYRRSLRASNEDRCNSPSPRWQGCPTMGTRPGSRQEHPALLPSINDQSICSLYHTAPSGASGGGHMELRLQDLPFEASTEFNQGGIAKIYEYLSKRGLKTPREVDELGIRVLRCADIGKGADDRAAIVFPHYDFSGNELDWWSARLVDVADHQPRGFAALVPKRRGKMFCPPREAPLAYYPRTIDWTNIAEGAVIYIHESCMKAINGARCLRYSVGLNGVWGWGSKKHDIALLPSLRDIPWKQKRLTCVVVFDSNASSNDDVALAIRRFAERMRLICKVDVRHMLLPKNPNGEDWGFDDFVEHYGVEHATAWLDQWEATSTIVEISELESLKLQLNEEVCIVRKLKRVATQDTGVLMGRGEFCDMNYAHYTAWVERGESETQVNVPKLWLQWERRRVVDDMDYMPGKETIHDGKLNLWKGMGLDPYEGDVSPWLTILENNIPDERIRQWVLQWMAYPLQNIGTKLNTYIHFWGPSGTGKQGVLVPLMKIYGERNAIIIGREQLTTDFNSIYANRQFINIDELHAGVGDSQVRIANKIKRLTTQETLTVNRKGEPEYEVTNCAQIVTTANYVDALLLDTDDRRCCVIQFGTAETRLPPEFWQSYYKWVDGGGAAAVYAYLLQVDCAGFDPKGWAPLTDDKKLVTAASRGPMEAWIHELIEDPDSAIMPILRGARMLTTEQLAQSYLAGDPAGRMTAALRNGLGQRLTSAGFTRLEIKADGDKVRLWVIRAPEGSPEGTRPKASQYTTHDAREEYMRFKSKLA